MATWIVPPNHRDLAPERYHSGYKPNVIQPIEAVIYHFTTGLKASGTKRWLTTEDDAFLSCHFLVSRGGTVWQMIPLEERGAHAGGSSSKLFGRGNVNGRTIGIEMMNVGPLHVDDAGELVDAYNRPFKGSPVSAGGSKINGEPYPSRMWEAYPTDLLDSVCKLTAQLCKHFPILLNDPLTRLVGHEHVDPKRKSDPGPAFPWEIIRRAATREF